MEHEQVRQLVLEVLRDHLLSRRGDPSFQANDVDIGVARKAHQRGFCAPEPGTPRPYDENNPPDLPMEDGWRVRDILWELITQGVIVPGNRGNLNTGWPFVSVTEHGDKVLRSEGTSPYDPSGYLGAVQEQSPKIDEATVTYLTEGLECFLRGQYMASVVMVGVAAEKVIRDLTDAVLQALASDASKSAEFRRKTERAPISQSFKEVMKRLEPVRDRLPHELDRDLDTYLKGVFDLIRSYRNEAGHPTGVEITSDIAHANLRLFRGFSQKTHQLIAHLREDPSVLTDSP